MRILITGGFGYLGGRLAQFLQQSGNHTIVLGTRDRKVKPEWLPNSEIVKIDWHSSDSLNQICKGVDVIIHLAGMNASECAADPLMALEFNGVATARFIQAAVCQNVKRFIYFSTAHVYDSPLTGDINESTLPKSYHPYATSHRAAEDVVLAAHSRKEIVGIVFRMSNAFGAPVNKEVNCWMLLVNDLCRQVITTNKLILNSTGLQRRDFITMNDVCRATLHLMNYDLNLLSRTLINLGGDWSPTVSEMANIISLSYLEHYGIEPILIRKDPSNNQRSPELKYNIDLLKSTGFVLQSSYGKEIKELLEFCKNAFQ
jgi:UDP-glucose 4-epimerase